MDHYLIGLLGSFYFAGWVTTLVFLPQIADKHGRKNVILSGMIVHVLGGIVYFFATNFYIVLLTSFTSGMATTCSTTILFVYVSEFFTERG